MTDPPPPPVPSEPSKAIVFAWRAACTIYLWSLISAIFFSRWLWACLGLIGVFAILATIEYFRLLRAAGVKCFRRFGILLTVGYCCALHAFFLKGQMPPPALDALAIFIALAGSFTLQFRQPIRGSESLLAVAVNVLGFIYIAVFFNFAARITFMVHGWNETPGRVSDQGAFLLLWLLAVTKFSDMGAYISGSMIGRHKMIPHVSPGKTWEGFGGALIFSQLAGCGLYAAFPSQLSVFVNYRHVITLGLLLAMFAVIGDLAESVLKRALNAKDSGRMLPGIGGVLDLIDSICFTAPVMYFYLKLFLLPDA